MKKVEKQPSGSNPNEPSIPGRIIIILVRFYQVAISPWLGANCRHQPTCSGYMIQAVKEWGALHGAWLGIRRILKCHPWGTSGYDPVPKKDSDTEAGKTL